MTKVEFEKNIKKINIQKVSYEDQIVKYFGDKRELYLDKKSCDLYGCFFEKEEKQYIIFFVDTERGIAKDLGKYKTEDEAYNMLFKYIKK